MNHRRRVVALSVNTLVFALLLAGCGGGDSDTDSTAGGSTGETGAGGDSQTTGGGGGSTAQTATGGTTQTTGAGGTAGQAAAGGTTQTTGAGGTAGQTAAGGTTQTTGTGGSAGAPEASCTTNVTPCGGDVVGTWTVAASCLEVSGEVDVAGFGLGCSSAPVTGSLQVAGTWTANADGTFADNTTTSGSETLEVPDSCLDVSGTRTTCNRISGPLASGLGYESVDCVEAASGGCTCTATVNQTGGIGLVYAYVSAGDNYTTADNVITAASGDLLYSYCVSASTLTMTPQSVSPKVTTGTVVFQMQ